MELCQVHLGMDCFSSRHHRPRSWTWGLERPRYGTLLKLLHTSLFDLKLSIQPVAFKYQAVLLSFKKIKLNHLLHLKTVCRFIGIVEIDIWSHSQQLTDLAKLHKIYQCISKNVNSFKISPIFLKLLYVLFIQPVDFNGRFMKWK